jgi:hypothetical protein
MSKDFSHEGTKPRRVQDFNVTHHRQRFMHDERAGVFGDCSRTCQAMVLGWWPDDIPNWSDKRLFSLTQWQAQQREWFLRRGVAMFVVAFEMAQLSDVLRHISLVSTGPVTLGGKSPRGEFNHEVVVLDGRLIDPHPSDAGLAGPCLDDGLWWVTILSARPSLRGFVARQDGEFILSGCKPAEGCDSSPSSEKP